MKMRLLQNLITSNVQIYMKQYTKNTNKHTITQTVTKKHKDGVKGKGFYLKELYGRSLEPSNPKTFNPKDLAKLGEAMRGGEGLERERRGQTPREGSGRIRTKG